MKKYYLLLVPLFFTACMDNAKPLVLDDKFKAYNKIQTSCLKVINDKDPHCEEKHCDVLPSECKQFISVLSRANSALILMKKNKNNASFYSAKEKYKKQKKYLKLQHRHLNLVIKAKALDAIDDNDLKQFTKLVQFSYHPMNVKYYHYMKKNMPHFENTNKYFYFEKKYSKKKYNEGLSLINKGLYTQGLGFLEVAASMKSIPAAQLCGDAFSYIYPSKAKKCYQSGVNLGDTHMMLSLAREYEKENNTRKAYEWYLKSAMAGNFMSQFKLYTLEAKDNIHWLKKSADSDYDKAQYTYAMYMYNKREYAVAKKYLLKASKQGYQKVNYPLGKLYFSQKSYKKAYAYLNKGSVNADSLYKLGYLKEYGKGTSRNYYTASKYYTKAKRLGKKNVQKDINRLNSHKKRLHKAQVKKQKASAQASYAHINARAKRKTDAQKIDAGIRASWEQRKIHEKELKAQACGEEPSKSILKRQGSRVHLQGRLTQWLHSDSFLVEVSGKEYLVKDSNDKGGFNKGDYINIVAVSTGGRQVIHGLKKSIFEDPDESSIEKAYTLNYDGVCPY
ncbi:MAG TPA: sel1 repeat family protein [Sulfurimonas sp.]|nr:sel1 repeat family protein [Sulfurimonas sp.]